MEENELEEWTDFEAVYAAPSAQTSASTPHFSPKVKYADDRTNEEEDSDQDWILPSSRKRKNKRPCEYIKYNIYLQYKIIVIILFLKLKKLSIIDE